jgi:tetratricopeptide (TPR) repeat protein
MLAMRYIADIYWGKTDLKSALNYANQAKSLAQEIDNQKEYAEANLIIGKVYTDMGDYEKSSELNFEALKIFEKENDTIGMGKAISRIGSVYFDQRKWDKALEYYLRSLQLAKELHDDIGISRGLNNVAAVYANKNEFRNFEENIKEAIKINKKIGRRLWEGINYLNLGIANEDNHNFDTAYFYIQKSISIFTELNNIPKLSVAYIIFSNYYSEINDPGKSLHYAKKAYQIGEANKLKNAVHRAARRLHEIYL